ncbi:hypothetical protein G6048_12150 [Streptomyces sp. YC419]|uniref:Proline rich protein membrane protein n=1 Tax=Streptomyces ureilyticus TaxID=1775131 RepID=A0ABX0DUY4_9ACTN|nr:hypothetical protein [Streptomyces ureilyticus]
MRLWRWRRNALRRRCDVIEAWVVLAAWGLAVVGGLLAAVTSAGAAERVFDRQRSGRQAVSAVLTEDAPAQAHIRAVHNNRVWVTVRWTVPDGSVRTGEARVVPDTAAGSRVTVWTDERDRLVSAPLSPMESAVQAAVLGALAAVGTGGAVWGGVRVVRGRVDRWRMKQWAAEWREFGPRWGRMTG